MTSTTTAFPPGIYHIIVAGVNLDHDSADVEPAGDSADGSASVQRQYLTDAQWVTVEHSPGAHPSDNQEWRVDHGKDGNVVIGRPSNKWPSPFLTYEGSSKGPEQGDRIKVQVSDFPLNEWHLDPVPGRRYKIRVANSAKLGIGIGPQKIFPPFLILSERELTWVFEFVRPQ